MLKLYPPESGLQGEVDLPASKSMLNRAMILGATLPGSTLIQGNSEAEDCKVMKQYLKACGFNLEESNTSVIVSGQSFREIKVEQDLIMSGTALRFLSVLACTLPLTTIFTGTERLSQRPLKTLLDSLKQAGADIYSENNYQNFPLHIQGNPDWSPSVFQLPASLSSQFISAVLLMGAVWKEGTQILINKEELVSLPYINMSLQMLRNQGIDWENTHRGWELKTKNLTHSGKIEIEPDWSAASYFLALACIFPANIILKGLQADSLQGDAKQLEYFKSLGMDLSFEPEGLRVISKPYKNIPAFDIDFSNTPDLAQTFAVLALFASGECILRGLSTLRVKETDRIQALYDVLSNLGAEVKIKGNDLYISPIQEVKPCVVECYGDHRMAMAFSVVAAYFPGRVGIKDPDVTVKSFPSFWEVLTSIGMKIILP